METYILGLQSIAHISITEKEIVIKISLTLSHLLRIKLV